MHRRINRHYNTLQTRELACTMQCGVLTGNSTHRQDHLSLAYCTQMYAAQSSQSSLYFVLLGATHYHHCKLEHVSHH